MCIFPESFFLLVFPLSSLLVNDMPIALNVVLLFASVGSSNVSQLCSTASVTLTFANVYIKLKFCITYIIKLKHAYIGI